MIFKANKKLSLFVFEIKAIVKGKVPSFFSIKGEMSSIGDSDLGTGDKKGILFFWTL